MSALIAIGYHTEKPLLRMSSPYDAPISKNPTQIGSVYGSAALKAFFFMIFCLSE